MMMIQLLYYKHTHTQDMAAEVLNHNAQLYDQSALVYLFKKNPDLLERVFFEHKWKYGFHVHYLSDMPIAQVCVCRQPQWVCVFI